MTFGERLTQLRKENGYATRNDFADKLGIPSTTLRNYETNVREPGHTFLKQISELFNVSVDYLLCLTDEKEVLKSFRIRSSEQNMIERYRVLDNFGKEHVDAIIDWEEKRMVIQQTYEGRIRALEHQKPTAPIIDFQERQNTAERITNYFHSASAGNGVFILGNEATDQIALPDIPEYENIDYAIDVIGDSMEPDYNDGDIVLVSQKKELFHGDVGIFIINSNVYIKEYGETELISRNPNADNIKIAEYDNIVCMGKVIGKLNK